MKYKRIDSDTADTLKKGEYERLKSNAYQRGAFNSRFTMTYEFEVEYYNKGIEDSRTANIVKVKP